MPDRRTTGREGEDLAAAVLESHGYRILDTNFRSPFGEIDIVAEESGCLVFVEVKTRQSDRQGHPSEAVTPEKQRRLTRLAVTFLKRHHLHEHPARFDVIGITWPDGGKPRVEHFVNAFDAAGQWEFYS